MNTVNQCQAMAHELIKPKKEELRQRVLEVLGYCPEGLTAQEIAEELGLAHRQDVAPRLSELVADGRVHEIGKRLSKKTKVSCTVYQSLENWKEARKC